MNVPSVSRVRLLSPLFLCVCGLALLASGAQTSVAGAQVPLLTGLGGPQGFGTDCLSTNDDGSSNVVDLTPAFPTGLQFFSARHMSAFVNTNGNITFSDSLSAYTPDPFPVARQPMIAPYWADVDIRGEACISGSGADGCANPESNGVWWHLEPGLMVITWHRVGYYDCATDKEMNFQLILSAAEGCGTGDFDVEFRFNTCEWHTGDASGGEGGVCDPDPDPIFPTECTPGQSGFDAGNSVDFVEIMNSRTETINTTLCEDSNVGETGIWRFQIRSGTVVCPDAGEVCDTGMMGACSMGATQCVGGGTECAPVIPPRAEVCDAVDNDCNGSIDDGDELCGTGRDCVDGVCVSTCFEFSCPSGQVCNALDLCVNEGCEDVTCETGQRCVDGRCTDACDGVTCPGTQTCRAGACLDLCGMIECDDCTFCDDGMCVDRCTAETCAAGEVCEEDGRCVEAGCAGISCPATEICLGGACVDACEGATCPIGQGCADGECVPESTIMPDAGAGGTDAGGTDSGVLIPDSGSRVDAGIDAAVDCPPGFDCTGTTPPTSDGCDCAAVSGSQDNSPWAILGSALLFAVVGFRRRRR